jgi:hypothetical protein
MSKKFPNEKDVKKHIKAILDKHGWFWWMPPANGFGQTGISDFHAIKAHVFMVIEAKYMTKVTDMQKGFLNSIAAEGGQAFVVSHKNIDSFEAWNIAFDHACEAGLKGNEPTPEYGAMMFNAVKELTDPWR